VQEAELLNGFGTVAACADYGREIEGKRDAEKQAIESVNEEARRGVGAGCEVPEDESSGQREVADDETAAGAGIASIAGFTHREVSLAFRVSMEKGSAKGISR
jgi:hypothetical protein